MRTHLAAHAPGLGALLTVHLGEPEGGGGEGSLQEMFNKHSCLFQMFGMHHICLLRLPDKLIYKKNTQYLKS